MGGSIKYIKEQERVLMTDNLVNVGDGTGFIVDGKVVTYYGNACNQDLTIIHQSFEDEVTGEIAYHNEDCTIAVVELEHPDAIKHLPSLKIAVPSEKVFTRVEIPQLGNVDALVSKDEIRILTPPLNQEGKEIDKLGAPILDASKNVIGVVTNRTCFMDGLLAHLKRLILQQEGREFAQYGLNPTLENLPFDETETNILPKEYNTEAILENRHRGLRDGEEFFKSQVKQALKHEHWDLILNAWQKYKEDFELPVYHAEYIDGFLTYCRLVNIIKDG